MSETHTSEDARVAHVLTTNGMGYFWCSCDLHIAHVLWSINEHIAEIQKEADAAGFQRGVAEAEAEVSNAFMAWAAKNEIAAPPLDWNWFGEIARRYSPLHEEYGS